MLIIQAVGRLGNDPEAFQAGTLPAARFNLAVNTGKDETTWLKCAVFGSQSARVLDKLKKGMKVTINGTGKHTFFKKRDETEGCQIEVNVLRFDISFPQKEQPSNVTPFPAQKSFNNNDIY